MASRTRQRETVEQKGRRLYRQGRVERLWGSRYRVRGEHGVYVVVGGRCDCPAHGRCSHVVAAEAHREEEEMQMEAEERERAEARARADWGEMSRADRMHHLGYVEDEDADIYARVYAGRY